MNRERIIYATVLLSTFAAFGAVYQFYFKTQFEKYAADERFRDQLQNTLGTLQEQFSNIKPDVLTAEWRGQIQPWVEARADRGEFFTFSDWLEAETPPEDGPILRFWYEEQVQAELDELYQLVAQTVTWRGFPSRQEIRGMFGVQSGEDFAGQRAAPMVFRNNLVNLGFGIRAAEMLLQAGASSVQAVSLYPAIPPTGDERNLLRRRRVGMEFTMLAEDLVDFLEDTRVQSDRYFHVEGLRIEYPYVGYNVDPQLTVSLVLTQADYFPPQGQGGGQQGGAGGGARPGAGGGAGGAAPPGAAGSAQDLFRQRFQQAQGAAGNRRRPSQEEDSWWFGWYRWFMRTVLATNV